MVKNPSAKAGEVGLISGSGRSLGEGNGNPLQYFSIGNAIDRVGYSPWGHKKVGHDLQLKQHNKGVYTAI